MEARMLHLTQQGRYQLSETKGEIKLLTLGKAVFAWIDLEGIGEVLVASSKPHQIDAVLANGQCRLYEVKDEPELSDQQHLELSVGDGKWQGYLLPTGLPEAQKVRSRIIPSKEVITEKKAA
jgi:hypothetical protein